MEDKRWRIEPSGIEKLRHTLGYSPSLEYIAIPAVLIAPYGAGVVIEVLSRIRSDAKPINKRLEIKMKGCNAVKYSLSMRNVIELNVSRFRYPAISGIDIETSESAYLLEVSGDVVMRVRAADLEIIEVTPVIMEESFLRQLRE